MSTCCVSSSSSIIFTVDSHKYNGILPLLTISILHFVYSSFRFILLSNKFSLLPQSGSSSTNASNSASSISSSIKFSFIFRFKAFCHFSFSLIKLTISYFISSSLSISMSPFYCIDTLTLIIVFCKVSHVICAEITTIPDYPNNLSSVPITSSYLKVLKTNILKMLVPVDSLLWNDAFVYQFLI